ncbi:hypothetical protein SISSUDRAFT_1042396 [Sistotremastrum suecicum HHB10207 ss-3]|uniref:Uncharacterized protein n=1 Tax=Sistotremastrum suecicum HHB10207 ss-3 TaxID=1314776 RepID=A0A166GNL6_9AGAM|nr:hypothetical protein SISSUDRAFT_1042396 [Sistotremastrum suecicum HHB10207 ss-3]
MLITSISIWIRKPINLSTTKQLITLVTHPHCHPRTSPRTVHPLTSTHGTPFPSRSPSPTPKREKLSNTNAPPATPPQNLEPQIKQLPSPPQLHHWLPPLYLLSSTSSTPQPSPHGNQTLFEYYQY